MPAMAKGERRRSRVWRVLQIVLAVAIVGAVFLAVIPRIADYQDVWGILTALTAFQILLVAAAAIGNLVTYWLQSIAALPGLTLPMAAVQTQTTTTIANTVPGGGALAVGMSFAMFRSWGYSDGDVARYTVVTYDRRGFSRSRLDEPPADGLRIADDVADAVQAGSGVEHATVAKDDVVSGPGLRGNERSEGP